jgi:TolB-like protein
VTDIFLSYNREDQIVARRFADAFAGEGYDVWWDTTLRAGEAYDEVTEAALRSAKAVVVLWSQKSVASRWVRTEALAAQRLNTLVPCMIEPCERPIMFELTQTAELYGWKGNKADPRWIAFLSDLKSCIARHESASDAGRPTASQTLKPKPTGVGRRDLLVGGGALALGAGLVGLLWSRFAPNTDAAPSQGGNSVAVLPFINLSPDEGQAYFSDGLSAEIRAELASNPGLKVAAQTSSAVFKVRTATAQSMAKQLGVAFLLDGNVRKASGTARIVAELIDGKSGITTWTQTFDRPLIDIFAVQSEIASAVVTALLAKLPQSAGDTKAPARATSLGGTTKLEAYESFLRGRALYESALSLDTDRQSLAAFDRAIAFDPKYAAAHAWRARALSVIASQSGDAQLVRTNHQAALAAARQSVALAPTFAEGYSALGFVLFTNGLDARAAKPVFDKSLEYGSGDGDVLTGFAMFSARTGRAQQAADAIARAIERDPLNPTVYRSAGQIAAIARDYQGALVYYDRALALNPKASVVNSLKGYALYWLAKLPEARAAYAAEPNLLFGLPGLAILDKKLGQTGSAEAALAKLIADFGDSGLFQQAQVYAGWGDTPRALETLERAYVAGDTGLSSLYTDPIFASMRQEPRFIQLLMSVGFI